MTNKSYNKGKDRVIYNLNSFYLDGAHGNDGNDGRSAQKAVKTVSKLLSLDIKSHDTIFIARGSAFREFLDIKGKGIDHITITAYGSGKRPVFDAADIASNTLFSKTVGWINIYEISWTNQFRDNTDMSQYSVWEDGWRLVRVNSMADLDRIPGSFYASAVSQPGGTDLIRVHSRNSDAVNTNNHLYEITRRPMGIHVGDNGSVYNMHTRRNGSNNGSFEAGHDSHIYGVLAEDGVKHNFFMASGKAENCMAWKSDNPAIFGGNTLFISYTNSPHADTMNLEYKNCQVIAGRNDADQAQYGSIGIYAHSGSVPYRSLHVSGGVFANTSTAVSAQIKDVIIDGAFFINNYSAATKSIGNLTFRNNRVIPAEPESALVISADNKLDSVLFCNNKVYLTGSNQKCAMFVNGAPAYLQFTDNTVFSNSNNFYLVYCSYGGGTLNMRRNLSANTGKGSIVPFIVIDDFSKTNIQADSNHYAIPISRDNSTNVAWLSINTTLRNINEVKSAGYEKNSEQEPVQDLKKRIYGVYGTTDFFLPQSDVLFGKQGSSNTFDGKNRYPYQLGDTLPVKIKNNDRFTKIFDFSANRMGRANVLHWTIGGSDDILNYKIEISTDSINFSNIGSVQHKKGEKKYNFIHAEPVQGNIYYSVIAIDDKSNKIESDTVLLSSNPAPDSIYSMAAYPNPVEGILHLRLNSQEAGKISIAITGMDGKNVLQLQQSITQGNQIIDLNLHTLQPGIYNMQVILNQEKKIIRIFKR